MRNFTNASVFDDTLPTFDGRMEIGGPHRSTNFARRWRVGSGARDISCKDSHLILAEN